MRTFLFLFFSAIPFFVTCRQLSPRTAQPPAGVVKRQPAPVMSFHGADWLERAGREQEDRPDLVLEAMNLKAGDVAAEVGCGTGFFARRMARKVAPSGKVYAVDIQQEMLQLLKQFSQKERVSNIVPVLGEETNPKLPQGALDWILLVDVYHEFQKPEPMLAAMKRTLATGGRIMLVEYRLEGDSASHIKLEHRMSVEQVLAEWLPAGFTLERRIDTLPSQHMFVFRAAQ